LKKSALLATFGIIFVIALGLRLYRFAPIWPNAQFTDTNSALPPGLQLDEGFNDLLALRFLRSGVIVPHFAIDQGIAAAHIYLTALIMRLTGPLAEAGRLASVVAGLLSIPAMIWLIHELFRTRYSTSDQRLLQILAAAQVAGTFWFVFMSRLGLELIVVPLLTLPAFAMLWRWLHRPVAR
jgi:4-amino-4-deoxy-L-arabinose transferase-like glycosyltransferase